MMEEKKKSVVEASVGVVEQLTMAATGGALVGCLIGAQVVEKQVHLGFDRALIKAR